MRTFSPCFSKAHRQFPARLAQFARALAYMAMTAGLVAQAQTLDSPNPAPNGEVDAMAVQPDGKLLLGGLFTMVAGQPYNSIARLNSDGSLDGGFNPGSDGFVQTLLVQPDGKILVGGGFNTLAGQPRTCLGRLNADGSLDTSINPRANNTVLCLALQTDGKFLMGGFFTNVVGQPRSHVARLNANGSLDSTFNPGASDTVRTLAIQPDGKILLGGDFTSVGGQAVNQICRLNKDGTVDTNFTATIGGSSPSVFCLTLQSDNSILVGGNFSKLNGQDCLNLGRLNPDGSMNNAFIPNPDAAVTSISLQTDGKIIIGGVFRSLNGLTALSLARLNPDGTPDGTFISSTDGGVTALALQADGKVVVGGFFTTLNGQPRGNFGRLNNTYPATQNLSYNASTITWLRGGSSPEVWRASFENSINGVTWNNLGDGVRLPGAGWQLTGVAAPTNFPIRARGFVSGGADNGSSWFSETMLGSAPLITQQPASRTNALGSTATFTVQASGSQPMFFHWRKNTTALTDIGNISGSQTATLTLSNVSGADFGAYSVVVSNLLGVVTSQSATLSLADPAITLQPVSRTNFATTSATFTVAAVGTPPVSYQWRKGTVKLTDGPNISGSQSNTLTLNSVLGADAGSYSVVVSNLSRSIVSSVATLTVIDPVVAFSSPNQSVQTGDTVFFEVVALGTTPLSYQWQKNGTNLIGATSSSLVLNNVQRADIGNYGVAVGNSFGTAFAPTSTLAVNLATADTLSAAASGYVSSMAVQRDGKIIVGGAFTNLAGQPRSGLGRLNQDGTLDTAFNPGASGQVNALLIQPDDKILVAGTFTNLAGQPRNYLGRLNLDGSLDASFTATADGAVIALAMQADGKTVVGGTFASLGGQSRTRIGRLNADGSLDADFKPSANSDVSCLAVQSDGKILAGGAFTGLAGQTRWHVGRLNDDGSLDSSFVPVVSSWVFTLAVQPDQKILLGGAFDRLAGVSIGCLTRLNPDGTRDSSFNPNANDLVYSVVLQADGGIMVGGSFTSLAGRSCNYLGRLNIDGSMDLGFNPNPDATVYSLTLQPNGKTLVGGTFKLLNGKARSYLGRLNATDPATENLSFNSSTITWLRSGTLPEVWLTSFEVSTNFGGTWQDLGIGTRVSGGWELTGLTLPANNAVIRAHGFVPDSGVSSWIVESIYPAALLAQPTIARGDGSFGFISNQFGFNISGSAGQSIVVEASTNLVNWTPLTNTILGSSPYFFSDPAAAGIPTRFYRARLQ
jgi:uncharacterized delta-60 repeat protein